LPSGFLVFFPNTFFVDFGGLVVFFRPGEPFSSTFAWLDNPNFPYFFLLVGRGGTGDFTFSPPSVGCNPSHQKKKPTFLPSSVLWVPPHVSNLAFPLFHRFFQGPQKKNGFGCLKKFGFVGQFFLFFLVVFLTFCVLAPHKIRLGHFPWSGVFFILIAGRFSRRGLSQFWGVGFLFGCFGFCFFLVELLLSPVLVGVVGPLLVVSCFFAVWGLVLLFPS